MDDDTPGFRLASDIPYSSSSYVGELEKTVQTLMEQVDSARQEIEAIKQAEAKPPEAVYPKSTMPITTVEKQALLIIISDLQTKNIALLERLEDQGREIAYLKQDFEKELAQAREMEKEVARLSRGLAECLKSRDDLAEDIRDIRDYFPKLISEDRSRIFQLEQRPLAEKPVGDKTEARIKKLKDCLKARNGGGITFKEAQKVLGIDKFQMAKIIPHLDRRSFEIFLRDGDSRQKVIRLKARIGR